MRTRCLDKLRPTVLDGQRGLLLSDLREEVLQDLSAAGDQHKVYVVLGNHSFRLRLREVDCEIQVVCSQPQPYRPISIAPSSLPLGSLGTS